VSARLHLVIRPQAGRPHEWSGRARLL